MTDASVCARRGEQQDRFTNQLFTRFQPYGSVNLNPFFAFPTPGIRLILKIMGQSVPNPIFNKILSQK